MYMLWAISLSSGICPQIYVSFHQQLRNHLVGTHVHVQSAPPAPSNSWNYQQYTVMTNTTYICKQCQNEDMNAKKTYKET